MSFGDVILALADQVKDYSPIREYVNPNNIFIGFRENLPSAEYMIIFEPGVETEEENASSSKRFRESEYGIDVYVRMIIPSLGHAGMITGKRSKPGLLQFTDDIKQAIRNDFTLGLRTASTSVSAKKTSGTYALASDAKNISVNIGSINRAGYDTITCGDSSLSGAAIAANIQAALRALGREKDDGYTNATCVFDSGDNRFTITSGYEGPRHAVAVTSGSSDDCSSILGFDSPTEEAGKNVTKIEFGAVTPNNEFFPVRYRVLPLIITEEIKIR